MYDFLIMNFAPVIGIISLLIFLYTNMALDKKITQMFKVITYLSIVQLIIYDAEMWTATWSEPSVWRMVLSVLSYTLRPLMLYCIIILILRNHENKTLKMAFMVPTIVVFLCYCVAFFSKVSFYFTPDNKLVRGPLAYSYFIVMFFYFLVALYLSMKAFQSKSQEGVINIAIIAFNVFAIVVEAIWQRKGFGGTAMVYAIVFYYMYFQSQSSKKEALEQAELTNRYLQEKNTIIGALSTEYSSVFIIDWDTSEIRLYNQLSEQFEYMSKLMGWCKYYEEAIETYIRSAIAPENRQEIKELTEFAIIKEELTKQGIVYVNFHRVVKDVDDYAQFVYSVVQRQDGDKNIVLAIRSINEIVEAERQKKELLEENLRYMEVVNALSAEYGSIMYYDPTVESMIPYRLADAVSEKFMRILAKGMRYTDLLRIYIENIVYEEDRPKVRDFKSPEYLMELLEKSGQCSCTYRVEKDGQILYYQMKAVRTGHDGEHYGAVIGFANKDEEVRRELRHQQELELALSKAEQANKAKSTFLFNMSHDIRTPMNAILGFIGIAKKSINDEEKVMDALGKIEVSGIHLLQLINDILDMSRIENNKVVIKEKPVSLRAMIGKLETMVQTDVNRKKQALAVEFKNLEDNYVYMDELRGDQIALNLLSNAVKYTGEGGSIRVTVVQNGQVRPGVGSYDFIVEDNGIGIRKDFLEHIYEPFTRERTTTISGVQGTGLGMPITKKLVELMDGSMQIESEEGNGTRVVVHLELRICDEKQFLQREGAQKKEYDFTGKRVLVVEDNELNREIVRTILTEEKFLVEEAENGAVAVELLKQSAALQEQEDKCYYDVILMDIQMPVMDGYETTVAIRALDNPVLAGVPIIAFTANAFDEDRKKALGCGMNAHVAKPLNVEQLKAVIKKMIG